MAPRAERSTAHLWLGERLPTRKGPPTLFLSAMRLVVVRGRQRRTKVIAQQVKQNRRHSHRPQLYAVMPLSVSALTLLSLQVDPQIHRPSHGENLTFQTVLFSTPLAFVSQSAHLRRRNVPERWDNHDSN